MAQAKQPTHSEIVIATWPAQRGMAYFDSHRQMFDYSTSIGSAYIYLRGIVPDECGTYLDSQEVCNMVVYIWMDRNGTISLDIRMKEAGSQNERGLERHLKTLRRLNAKTRKQYPALGEFVYHQRAILPELLHLFAALGVKRAVEYRPGITRNSYIPATDAIRRIADTIEEQIKNHGGWITQPQQEAA